MISVLQNADRGQFRLAPFPHFVLQGALPRHLYQELDKTRPPIEAKGSNIRKDIHAAQALLRTDLPSVWRWFIEFHTSQAFWGEVLTIFGPTIRYTYPFLEWDKPLRQYTTGVRFRDQADVFMECQPGINTPVERPSRVRGPHLDNPVELVAGMLYMKASDEPQGGDLEVCQTVRAPQFYGKAEIYDKCVETVGVVPYRANTLVMFMNSPVSIHSVTERPVTTTTRKLVNFAMELPFPLFEVPKDADDKRVA